MERGGFLGSMDKQRCGRSHLLRRNGGIFIRKHEGVRLVTAEQYEVRKGGREGGREVFSKERGSGREGGREGGRGGANDNS